MAEPKPYTIDTHSGETIPVNVSERKECNWHIRRGGENYHIDTKDNVNKLIEKLGYEIV